MSTRPVGSTLRKKPYSEPSIKKVRLATELAHLSGCKSQGGSGPWQTCDYFIHCKVNVS